MVPGRPRRPVEPRRGGHGPRPRRPPRRRRPGLRVAHRPPARGRLLAPVLRGRRPGPHRRRAGQARRQRVRLRRRRGLAPLAAAAATAGFAEQLWPVVEKAIDFVLELQTPRGEILWARHADGTPWSFALLTGSSSICHSLRCAIALAELLGHERPDWELSAARLAQVIATDARGLRPEAPLGHGLVLPGARRRRARRRRPRAPAEPARHLRDGGQGRALRVRPPVGHGGRELRVRPGPPGRRRAPHRRGPLRLGPAVPPRGRPLLDRHRVPRRGPLPRRRALHLHRGRPWSWPPTPSPAPAPPPPCSSTTTRSSRPCSSCSRGAAQVKVAPTPATRSESTARQWRSRCGARGDSAHI